MHPSYYIDSRMYLLKEVQSTRARYTTYRAGSRGSDLCLQSVTEIGYTDNLEV